MADLQDIQIIDPGVDDAIARLTPERIEQTINRVLTQECAARLEAYRQTCVHCGLCAEACQSYVSRNGDPDYAPVANGMAAALPHLDLFTTANTLDDLAAIERDLFAL